MAAAPGWYSDPQQGHKVVREEFPSVPAKALPGHERKVAGGWAVALSELYAGHLGPGLGQLDGVACPEQVGFTRLHQREYNLGIFTPAPGLQCPDPQGNTPEVEIGTGKDTFHLPFEPKGKNGREPLELKGIEHLQGHRPVVLRAYGLGKCHVFCNAVGLIKVSLKIAVIGEALHHHMHGSGVACLFRLLPGGLKVRMCL